MQHQKKLHTSEAYSEELQPIIHCCHKRGLDGFGPAYLHWLLRLGKEKQLHNSNTGWHWVPSYTESLVQLVCYYYLASLSSFAVPILYLLLEHGNNKLTILDVRLLWLRAQIGGTWMKLLVLQSKQYPDWKMKKRIAQYKELEQYKKLI